MFKVQFHTYGVLRLGSIPRIVQGFAKQLSGVVGKTVPGMPVMAGSQLRPPAVGSLPWNPMVPTAIDPPAVFPLASMIAPVGMVLMPNERSEERRVRKEC